MLTKNAIVCNLFVIRLAAKNPQAVDHFNGFFPDISGSLNDFKLFFSPNFKSIL